MKTTQRTLQTDLPMEQSPWNRQGYVRPHLGRSTGAKYLVIGAGISGLSAAYHLSKMYGEDVLVIEAGRVGSGSTGKSTGIVTRDVTEQEIYNTIENLGFEETREISGYMDRAAAGLRKTIADESIDCDVRDAGSLCLFFDEKNADKELSARESVGQAAVKAGRSEISKYLRDAANYEAALHYPADFALNPFAFTQGLASASERTGRVMIYENTPALQIGRHESGTHEVLTPYGTIRAENMLIGTNHNAFDLDGIPRSVRRRVIPIDMFVSLVRCSDVDNPFMSDYNFWEEDTEGTGDYLFGRQMSPTELIVCGAEYVVYRSSRNALNPDDYADRNMSALRSRFPGKDFHVEKTWGGRMGITADDMPKMGSIGEGITVLSLGHGILPSYLSGQLAAAAVLHSDEQLPEFFDINGPRDFWSTLPILVPERLIGPGVRLYEKLNR